MKPRQDRPAPTAPEKPSTQPLVVVLEMVASQRPEFLPWLLSVVEHSPAHFTLVQLAQEWGLPVAELGAAAAMAAGDLDRLEASPSVWIQKRYLRKPHLIALLHFAAERRERAAGVRRRQRLDSIGRRLQRDLELDRHRRQIEDFLEPDADGQPSGLDRRSIEKFLGK